jgi:REP element-mobilizing transposase RayT
MARYPRIREPGLLHHVMARGNGRMRIFLDDTDYLKFQYILADVLDEYDVDCWDACLMPNHYHLALFNRRPNLPEAMQHLNGEYATWWNGRHGKVGHVLQGRYKDQIVQRDSYLLNLIRYIALNPVRAGLVGTPDQWPWSAFPFTSGRSSNPGFLCADPVLAMFGEAPVDVLRERYARYVLSGIAIDDESDKRFRSRQRIVGDREFQHQLRQQIAKPRLVPAGLDAIAAVPWP